MKKQILFAATALMLTAGVVAGSNEAEAKAPKRLRLTRRIFRIRSFVNL